MRIKSKNILVTGSSGFIGFHLSNYLLSQGYSVIGLDNLSDYYDVKLKLKRQKILQKNSNFICYNRDIEDGIFLSEIFKNHSPEIVIHLAAQAGVRYSIENPKSYINTNLYGAFNLLELLKDYPLKHLLFASSSSVYGGNSKLPFDEKQKCEHPLSLYAATKKANETMCHSYSYNFSIPTTMLRFFTVYGPWGRPDMALFKFTNSIINRKQIDLYNFGKMERDFTYIDDVVKSIYLLLDKIPEKPNIRKNKLKNDSISPVAPWRVVNVGNSKPVDIKYFVEEIEKRLGIEADKNYVEIQKGDVKKTWSKVDLLKNLTNFEPQTSVEYGVNKFIEWFLSEYNKH